MPAYAVPAVPHGATSIMPFAGSYALLSPVLGYPAGVVPVTRVRADEEAGRGKSFDVVERAAFEAVRGSAGLPIGVQLMGRPWRDDVVLAAMRVIEQAARKRADFPVAPKTSAGTKTRAKRPAWSDSNQGEADQRDPRGPP